MTFADYNIDLPPGRTSGQVYTICPRCSHDRKKKRVKCLSVNLDEEVWNCHHCQWTGSLKKKQYVMPTWENKTNLSDKVLEWFQKRNINQDTLTKMQIAEATEYMPQAEGDRKCICFPYIRKGKVINIKYRDSEKNFKMVTGAELIFFNIDAIDGQEYAYIVEGEIDCLTMVQAGYTNTVSVPNGASKGNNNLQYLDNCYQYFEGIKTVYILTDNDEPGIKLGQELARRIGIEKCFRIDLGEFKDVNEQLCKSGRVDVSKANPYPIEGVFRVSDHWEGVIDILKHGFPKGWKPRGELGGLITIHPGYTTIITGIPGHGKSELLDQMVLQLCIDHNLRAAYFSPENWPTEMHIIKLVEKLLGKSFWKSNDMEQRKSKDFLDDRIFWVYPEEGYGLDNVLEKIRQAVLRYGINMYVLDPWNKLEHQYEGSETKYVSESLDKIANFNKKNGTHGFIIAHPTKMRFNHDEGRYEIPGLYDISGSANFYNKADIGMCVYKNKLSEGVYNNSVYIQKVKFKYWGKTGQVEYNWNPENGRYDEQGTDFTYWLNNKADTSLIDFSEPAYHHDETPF